MTQEQLDEVLSQANAKSSKSWFDFCCEGSNLKKGAITEALKEHKDKSETGISSDCSIFWQKNSE